MTRTYRCTATRVVVVAAALAGMLGVLFGQALAQDGGGARMPALERGINLARAFNLPRRDADGELVGEPFSGPGAAVSDTEIATLAAVGFDHVRLPIDIGVMLDADTERRGDLLGRLEAFAKRLQGAGLEVLLDPHPYPGDPRWTAETILTGLDAERYGRYRALLLDLAGVAGRLDVGRTALGLMNEPQRACRAEEGTDWTVFQEDLYEAVRDMAPTLPIVLTTGCWSGIQALPELDMASYDDNTFIDLHFYDPYIFTHQSAPWVIKPFRFVAGLAYPASEGSTIGTLRSSNRWQDEMGNVGVGDSASAAKVIADYYVRVRADRGTIDGAFDAITAWTEANDVSADRILVGEFGAWRLQPPLAEAADGSRERWLRDVRLSIEERGFGWAHWEYTSPFGIVADEETRALDPATLRALGLSVSP